MHCEQLAEHKKELGAIYEDLLALDLDDTDDLVVLHSRLKQLQFGCSLKVKRLLGPRTSEIPTVPVDGQGVKLPKLPKLDVPTFDGDILNWTQFCAVSVHNRKNLSETEKLVYLQQAIGRALPRVP